MSAIWDLHGAHSLSHNALCVQQKKLLIPVLNLILVQLLSCTAN